LAYDLMWKICTPFLTLVNSPEKGEHPSYSRANYVPTGGRNPTPPRNAIVFAGQVRNKPLSNKAMEMVLRQMKVENATVHGYVPASVIGRVTFPVSLAKSQSPRWPTFLATRPNRLIGGCAGEAPQINGGVRRILRAEGCN
jgi:hypothetical protein